MEQQQALWALLVVLQHNTIRRVCLDVEHTPTKVRHVDALGCGWNRSIVACELDAE